jgi:hypothetical protein
MSHSRRDLLGGGIGKQFRGSRRRLRRIRVRDYTSWGFVLFAVFVLFLLVVALWIVGNHAVIR